MTYEELLKLKAYYIGMAKSPEKQPATPIHFVLQDKSQFIYTGMSKLEVVATAAMQGIISNPDLIQRPVNFNTVAMDAVNLAKALISEIEKSK